MITRSKKRQRLDVDGISTDPNAPGGGSEYGVVLETSKERFLVVRHDKSSQSASVDGTNKVPSDNPMFTISLIQGEFEVTGDLLTSTTAPTTKLEVPGELKSPLPTPEQPTKEPSPVESLPLVSTPQEVKQVAQNSERGRSTSVVDMELDTPASVTPTATTGPRIPDQKTVSSGEEPEPAQEKVQQNTKPTTYGNQSQHDGKAPLMERAGAVPLKSPSTPGSVTNPANTHTEVLPVTSTSVPRLEARSSPQVKFKLQILQRNVRGDDLVFGDDGLAVLSADTDPMDNTKKGWLIEAPRWRRYNGRISDCIVVN